MRRVFCCINFIVGGSSLSRLPSTVAACAVAHVTLSATSPNNGRRPARQEDKAGSVSGPAFAVLEREFNWKTRVSMPMCSLQQQLGLDDG